MANAIVRTGQASARGPNRGRFFPSPAIPRCLAPASGRMMATRLTHNATSDCWAQQALTVWLYYPTVSLCSSRVMVAVAALTGLGRGSADTALASHSRARQLRSAYEALRDTVLKPNNDWFAPPKLTMQGRRAFRLRALAGVASPNYSHVRRCARPTECYNQLTSGLDGE